MREIFRPRMAEFVELFYRHLFSFDRTAHFLRDPELVERLKKAQAFQDNIDNLFNFGGGRTAQEDAQQIKQRMGSKEVEVDATLTIAREARLLAGFTNEEIDRLIKGMGKSAAY